MISTRQSEGRMNRTALHRLTLLFGAALSVASSGCRQEPVDLPEIFITRSVGVNFLERGQLTEAETQFKKLIQLAPKDPFGYANLGLTYLRAGRYSDAERELHRAQKLDPTDPDVELIVARLYSLTGRWDEARATLEKLHLSLIHISEPTRLGMISYAV